MSRPPHKKAAQDKWLKAYEENDCLFETTCQITGIDTDIVRDWIDNNLYGFSSRKRRKDLIMSETVEKALIYNAKDKNVPVSQIFYLKNNSDKYREDVQDRTPIQLWFNKPKLVNPTPTIDGEAIDTKELGEGKPNDG